MEASSGAAQAVFNDANLVANIAKHLAQSATPLDLARAAYATKTLGHALAEIVRERCAALSPALVRLAGDGGNWHGLLRQLSGQRVVAPEPPRWSRSDFTWCVDVRLRGQLVCSFLMRYDGDGAAIETPLLPPAPCHVVVRDLFPFVHNDNTELVADFHVRRSDGALACIGKDIVGSRVTEEYHFDKKLGSRMWDCSAFVCFETRTCLVYTLAMWTDVEPDDSHFILPFVNFNLLFTAADALCLQQPAGVPPRPLYIRHDFIHSVNGEELSRPMRVSMNSPLLDYLLPDQPALQLLEEPHRHWLADGDILLSRKKTLVYLNSLKYI